MRAESAVPDEGPLSKTEYVLERLRRDILSGVFQPGEQLRQNDIASAYGVSPTPVREALRLLAANGLIVYSRHKGATVLGLDAQEIRDLYALRAAMEGLAVQIATDRLTAEDLERLQDINATLRTHRHDWSPETLTAMNREFHFGIYAASSPVITSHIQHILSSTPPFGGIWGDHDEADRLVREHDEIWRALKEGDGTSARALMEEHIMGSARYRENARRAADALPSGDSTIPAE